MLENKNIPFIKEAIFWLRQVDLKLKGTFQVFHLLKVSTGFYIYCYFNKFEFAKSVIFIKYVSFYFSEFKVARLN